MVSRNYNNRNIILKGLQVEISCIPRKRIVVQSSIDMRSFEEVLQAEPQI